MENITPNLRGLIVSMKDAIKDLENKIYIVEREFTDLESLLHTTIVEVESIQGKLGLKVDKTEINAILGELKKEIDRKENE